MSLWPSLSGSPVGSGETCVVVGNGPSAVARPLGRVIDAFDHVVRFNAFTLEGLEAFVGSRTTLCSNFGRGVRPRGELPSRVVYPLGSRGNPAWQPAELWRIPDEFIESYLKDWGARENPEGTLPSSGFLVCSWLLASGVPALHLVGFDHFGKGRSRAHHYWDTRSTGIPRPHNGPCEARAFAEWALQGRVFYLT